MILINNRRFTSLTFLFTDLKGSTALYERVGDLVAYDLVRRHFGVLHEIVASEAGAVVKTIGDAVMATFSTPDRALAAALRMREAMTRINAERGNEDLLLKIGIHEGPCLAVRLNNSQDYFGQTVNIAARVQGLASSRAIFVTQPVVEDPSTAKILQSQSLRPSMRRAALRGIADETTVFEIRVKVTSLTVITAREMGSAAILRRSNSQRPMSALGQKRTFRPSAAMSALPPKADIR